MEEKVDEKIYIDKNKGEIHLSKNSLEHPDREFTIPPKTNYCKTMSWFEFESL